MASLVRILGSRWFLSLIGTALVAALVWVFGPFLPALEGWVVRLPLVLLLVLIWAGANLLLDRRDRRRDAALSAGVAAIADTPANASAEEAAAMRDKLTAALGLLKRARGTRGYLYEQPWYVIIGPPGAGKTTALLNAGLQFPLAAEMGQGPVAGVGGTRMCDWWFTDDAVLIDTAGRYTTQDSDAAVDRAGWEAFLDLLRQTRARQPLNGVVVAISITDIAAAPAAERSAHARAIRKRVKELEARLGLRLPVYAIFTKCDLLAGFTEFFDDLDREKRAQVWGATFAAGKAEAGPVGGFATEFRALAERLDARLIDRLQAERSAERRARLAGFPAQFASIQAPLEGFLREAFGGSKLDPAPMLRGFYFSSGTQAGTPIDRLTGALSRTFGLDQRLAPSLRPEAGRSYFLARLLKDVIFNEAMLATEPPAVRRRRLAVRAAGFAAAGLAAAVLSGLLYAGRVSGLAEIDAAATALARYEQTARAERLDPVADADLPRLLPLLDAARGLPHGFDRAGEPSGGWFGLAQDDKLEASARAVYRHALGYALLPRLVWRLETQIRGNLTRPDFVYEATRVYLMLGGAGPLDRELVRAWMRADWSVAFPGAANAAARENLLRHLDAMLAESLPPLGLDGALVAQARTTFSRVPLALRVYSRIKPSRAAAALPVWKPADALGAAGAAVFMRASGKPLSDGIPGFLTVEGFHKVLLPSLGPAAKAVAAESWVLGQNAAVDATGPQVKGLERDVIALYEADYVKAWDELLSDLNLVPLRSLTQAAQDLYILASPSSPMRDLLAGVTRQLQLSVPPPAPKPAGGVAAAAAAAAQAAVNDAAAAGQAQLDTLLGAGNAAGPAPRPPGVEIDDRYKALIDLVGSGPGAPIDQVLRVLGDLQQQLAKLAAAPPGSAAPPPPAGNDPALGLRVEAQRQPQPLGRWLAAMATSGTTLRSGGARQQMAAAFSGPGGPATLCAPAVAGRYPFDRASANDVPFDDFAKLFAPGGLIDGFFNTQLRPYVDVSGPVWKPQSVEGVAPPLSADDLAQFQRAAVIRDLFFAAGTTPTLRFDITPTSLDAGARQVTLDLDGTELSYAHGPPRATQVTWPGPTRMQNVRLVFDPPPAGGTGVLSASGPWALFRLLDQGRLAKAGSAELYTLSFQLGERSVSYEVRAGSVLNPLAPGVLRDFKCPVLQ